MNEYTLTEIAKEFGASRRAIQGYEMYGLVKSVRKTTRGYLLYDENAIKRIKEIKLYQQMGFPLRQIAEVIGVPQVEKKIALCKKEKELMKRIEELTEILKQVKIMIAEL